jgi:alkyldihydroxyacetonephosphate synthase
MRRWNGWGDDSVAYPLPTSAAEKLKSWLGPGVPPQDAKLADVLDSVPPTRLPPHPLVDAAPLVRLQHACGQSLPDWISLRSGSIPAFPDGVAFPMTEQDVRSLIQFAQQAGIQLIPYGGGTSVVGHINPEQGDTPVMTIDLGRMNRLMRFDEKSLLATFGAGVCGPDLEAQLRARGCTLGHFPQSFEYSTLGGWVASRSSGQQSLRYGRIEKLFAGGHLETPAGILELPSFPASAAGPDLRQLVLGSEGRLGILTQATVRASRLPEREEFHAIFFPGFANGQEAVRQILQVGLPLSMLRLSTAVETQTSLALAGHEKVIGALDRLLSLRRLGDQKCMLLLGFSGTEGMVRAMRGEALGLAGRQSGVHVGRTFGNQWVKSRFRTPYLRNTLWEMGYAVDTLETALDWLAVPLAIEAIETALHTALAESGEKVHVFTHLSHNYPSGSSVYTTYIFRLAPDPQENLRRWTLLKTSASQAVVSSGGTISHQHGVGIDHAAYLPSEKGPLGMAVLRDVLQRFDPSGMMNPGKLLRDKSREPVP